MDKLKSKINPEDIPEHYIAQYFNQYVGYPKHKKSSNTYYGGCPFCREGGSWGKKARFFYIPKNHNVFCHNCGYSKPAHVFVMDVADITYSELLKDIEDYDILPEDIGYNQNNNDIKKQNLQPLPHGYINLTDPLQLKYYHNNVEVQKVVEYIKLRRLDVAVNRPKTYYTTLTDNIHKFRLILPFFNSNGDLIYYQSRKINNDKKSPNYLSKVNGDKILPNLNNVDTTIPYIFIFEGPIDSYFCKNGTAVSGIQENSYKLFSELQESQLKEFYLFDIIWVLDSQWKDSASISKTRKLLDMNQRVFIWPKKHGTIFKDFNEMAIVLKQSEISHKWILKNTHDQLTANLLLSQIEKYRK